MSEIEIAKRRLMIMLAVSGASALVAVGAGVGALVFHQVWLLPAFGAALILGFAAQIESGLKTIEF